MKSVKIIENQKLYEEGLAQIEQDERSFLQSYEYGLMQKELGHKAIFFGIFENEKIVQSYLWIIFKAKRGTFIFCPYGVFDSEKLRLILDFIKGLSKKEKIDFIRVSPNMEDNEINRKLFKDLGFHNAPVHMMHPELDWVLDISKDEKTLLMEMRKNNRYGIKKATKDGVTIIDGATQDLLDKFYKMHEQTAKRQGFVPWSKTFLDAQLKYFGPKNEIKIYLGIYDQKEIAGAVIMFYEEKAYYHHGASLSEYNKIPASYLIQWEAIKEAKKRGYKVYSFYGIIEDAPKHPWAGLSFFKKGFGGHGRYLLHCQDLKLTKKYWLNFAVEKIRRMKRGY